MDHGTIVDHTVLLQVLLILFLTPTRDDRIRIFGCFFKATLSSGLLNYYSNDEQRGC